MLSVLRSSSLSQSHGTNENIPFNQTLREPVNQLGSLNLFIGDWRSTTPEIYSQFDLIFNCTTNHPQFILDSNVPEGYIFLNIPEGKKGQSKLYDAIETVLTHYSPYKKTLVHCQQGIDRSAGITLAILLKYHNESSSEIKKVDILKQICFIQRYRQCVNPTRATTKQLCRYFVKRVE